MGPSATPPRSRRRWLRAGIALAVSLIAFKAGPRVLPGAPLRERAGSSTAIEDADGRLLRLTLAPDQQYRLWTPLPQLAPDLVEATLLYEDRHFYLHPGVNPASLLRGAWSTWRGGRRLGGSTITMQLARRLWRIPSHTPWGKLRQIARAVELELRYSKRELLEAYLNLAPYGGNIEGAAAASRIYFRKPVDQLSRPEALALAVIPQNPTLRSRSPAALQAARGALFRAFSAAHPEARRDEALFHLDLPLHEAGALPFLAPHFADEVLASAGGAAPHEATEIRTTLDLRLQRLLERRLHGYVARRREVGIRNAAAMLVDTRDLGIKALVGSADFHDAAIAGQVNGALARRSPGSALKPFVYALGIDQGAIHPATMLRDVPTAFAAYSPENFDGRFAGPLPAREALIRSRNIPALEVAAKLNRPSLYDFLRTAGVAHLQGEEHYGLGLALGNAEVTMEELLTLYAALGNRGLLRPLRWRAGDPSLPGTRILSEEASFITLDMLKDNPPPSGDTAGRTPVAWKTGTSWGFRDAWSVGLFGPYALAVWVGNFSGEGNPAFVGAQAAGPLFFDVVDAVVAEEAALPPLRMTPAPQVRRVEVCALSGGLPTASCPHRARSWFIPGRSPIAPCAVHRLVTVDENSGRRVCPPHAGPVRTEVYEFWPSDLARLFAAAGLPRRAVPPAAPGCEDPEAEGATSLHITSPRRGVTYTLRPGAEKSQRLALQAVADGGASEVFWFVDDRFVGRARAGAPLFVALEPGAFVVRAVDDLAHADTRELRVDNGEALPASPPPAKPSEPPLHRALPARK